VSKGVVQGYCALRKRYVDVWGIEHEAPREDEGVAGEERKIRIYPIVGQGDSKKIDTARKPHRNESAFLPWFALIHKPRKSTGA
jgi:hypothetical protein